MKDAETLMQRATILFPGPLNLEQVGALMGYIAKTMPANVSYRTDQFMELFHDPTTRELGKEEGTSGISGAIRRLDNIMDSDIFTSFPEERNTSMISGIMFNQIYSSGLERLWDEVRERVYNFFENT